MNIITPTKLVLCNTGVEGSGKTVSAATISKQCPLTLPVTKPAIITDTFWLCADAQALTSLASMGVTVKDTFDIPVWMSTHPKEGWTGGVRNGLMAISAWLAKHPNGNVVVDTLSSISSGLQNEFAKDQIGQQFSIAAPADGRKMYGQLKVALSLFTDYLIEMPFGICLVLVHLKSIFDQFDGSGSPAAVKAAAAKAASRQAGKSLEGADLVADVEGSGFKYFKRHALMMLPVIAKRAPNAKTRKRFFITNPANPQKLETKMKFEGWLPDEVDANWLKVIAAINAHK